MVSTMHSDVAVIVPAYNEGKKILETLLELNTHFNFIVVIDDGSTDDTKQILNSSAAKVLHHPINLGQGAALQTGITFALRFPQIRYILTFDADGQHSIKDALDFVQKIRSTNVDIVLGSRFLGPKNSAIPKKKKLILRLGIVFTRFDSGLNITDTHNGLRVMTSQFAKTLNLKQAGMAHASEILRHIKQNNSTWIELPAEIHYTPYSISKGQSIFNAVNILTEMMHK